jgi:hypothetical protein
MTSGSRIVRVGGEANEVNEQDRDDLALLHLRSEWRVQRRGALRAELSLVRVVLATVRAQRVTTRYTVPG